MPELLLIGNPARTAPAAARLGARQALPRDVLSEGAFGAIDGAALLLEPGESPHAIGYALFLDGTRVRIGRSAEFGGLALSRCLPADADDDALIDALLAGVAA